MLYLKLIQFNTDFELPFLGAAIQSHTGILEPKYIIISGFEKPERVR